MREGDAFPLCEETRLHGPATLDDGTSFSVRPRDRNPPILPRCRRPLSLRPGPIPKGGADLSDGTRPVPRRGRGRARADPCQAEVRTARAGGVTCARPPAAPVSRPRSSRGRIAEGCPQPRLLRRWGAPIKEGSAQGRAPRRPRLGRTPGRSDWGGRRAPAVSCVPRRPAHPNPRGTTRSPRSPRPWACGRLASAPVRARPAPQGDRGPSPPASSVALASGPSPSEFSTLRLASAAREPPTPRPSPAVKSFSRGSSAGDEGGLPACGLGPWALTGTQGRPTPGGRGPTRVPFRRLASLVSSAPAAPPQPPGADIGPGRQSLGVKGRDMVPSHLPP